eukprot:g2124.t1
MRRWYFTVRGPCDTDFEGGIYHGIILLDVDYPYKPPNIMWLTPNGRFEVRKKICLSITAHHPEQWMPAWGVRTILEALISFLPTPGGGAIGALDYTPKERRALAKKSTTKNVDLPSEYKEHLKRWTEKFPTLTAEDDRIARQKFDTEATQSLHFRKGTRTKSEDENGQDKLNQADEDDKTPASASMDEKTESTMRRRSTQSNEQTVDVPKTRQRKKRRVVRKQEPPNHLMECAGFLLIAILIALVLSIAKSALVF